MSTHNAEQAGEVSPIAQLTQAAEAQFAAARDLVVTGQTEAGTEYALYLAGPPVGTPEQQRRFSGSLAMNGRFFSAQYRPGITAKPYLLTRETTYTGNACYRLDTVPEDHFSTMGRMEPENIAIWDTSDYDRYKDKVFKGLHSGTLHALTEATPYNHETHMLRPSLVKGEPDVLVPRDSMRTIHLNLGKRSINLFFTAKVKRNK